MKISQKGLYALQAMMRLARRYNEGAIRIRDIAYDEGLPEKFLELILLELKNARMVESVRGAKGGYRLRRPPSEIYLAEIIRLMDGALAPFGDAEQLREPDRERRRAPRAVPGISRRSRRGGPHPGKDFSGRHHQGRHAETGETKRREETEPGADCAHGRDRQSGQEDNS